jgi:hypothetical protein
MWTLRREGSRFVSCFLAAGRGLPESSALFSSPPTVSSESQDSWALVIACWMHLLCCPEFPSPSRAHWTACNSLTVLTTWRAWDIAEDSIRAQHWQEWVSPGFWNCLSVRPDGFRGVTKLLRGVRGVMPCAREAVLNNEEWPVHK